MALSVITVHIAQGLSAPTISPVLSRNACHAHDIVSAFDSLGLRRANRIPC